MRVYFDSSAFAKRYVRESGTEAILEWCDRASELAMSVIAIPEIISAFCRLRREARFSEAEYQGIKRALLLDIQDALICDTTPEVLRYAIEALERYALRGMDAIHLGTAIVCSADVFLSADTRQCQAAESMGLQVIPLR